MKFGKLLSATLTGVALALSTQAHAVPITGFGDPTDDAALAGGTVIDFDSTAAGLYSSLTIGDVTFSSVSAAFNIGSDFNGSFNTSGGQSLFNGSDLIPDDFRIDFLTTVDAFGFNWGASDNNWIMNAYDAGGTLIESTTVTQTFGSNSGDYFGIAASGISYITLTDQHDNFIDGDYVFMDDFTYTASASVPEPSVFALLGLGLIGISLARMKKER